MHESSSFAAGARHGGDEPSFARRLEGHAPRGALEVGAQDSRHDLSAAIGWARAGATSAYVFRTCARGGEGS
eukprot:2160901-Pleurochrysis_carterae.AAC.2